MSRTIAQEDDFVVSRLSAPLRGIEQLDVVHSRLGTQQARGRACLACAPDRAGGERVLADYTFNHTPS